MKKWITIILMLTLLVTGCAKKDKIVVDTIHHTVTRGDCVCEYTDTTQGDTRTIIIRYPDGGTYTWTQTGDKTQEQMEIGPGISRNGGGNIMVHAIVNPQTEQEEKTSLHWTLIIIGIPVIVLGLVQVLYPVAMWDLFLRRVYHEDPSEYALTRIISGGIGQVLLGVALILIGIFA